MITIPAWSYSSLTKYETCPRQYAMIRVYKKVKDEMGEAALWGNKVHGALEHRVKNNTPLPVGMTQWEPIAAQFDKVRGKVFTEQKYALTKNLHPCGWFDKTAWVRGIIDLHIDKGKVVTMFDYKTGKVKPDIDQMKLFAGFIFAAKPYVEKVRTAYIWLQYNSLTKESFKREDVPLIWEEFVHRSERLADAYRNDKWPARHSGLCEKYCPVSHTHCEFSGRR